MGALEKKGLLYSLGIWDWVFGIITCPTNLWDSFTMILGIGFIVLPTLGFIISFFSLIEIEYRIHNLNPIPTVYAQDIKTQPTEEELKRAEEILREFQRPEERVKGLGVGDSGSGIGKSQIPNTEDLTPNPQLPKPEHGKLFYFFSFSMPTQSLRTILPEIEKTGAVMVLRGMKEEVGFRKTMLMVADLLKHGEKESYQAEVWIHPVLFRCFNIDSVPQIVYVTGTQDEEGCSSSYIKVKGDVSIEYALRLIAKEDKSAKKYLKLLKDSFYEKD